VVGAALDLEGFGRLEGRAKDWNVGRTKVSLAKLTLVVGPPDK
jgi:hypothetical protein